MVQESRATLTYLQMVEVVTSPNRRIIVGSGQFTRNSLKSLCICPLYRVQYKQ